MRRIKFRGRSINYVAANDSYWAYGLLVNDDPPEIECDDGDIYRVNDNTVGQFTGLKDCKGQEIYEGDVLRDPDGKTFEVVWNNGAGSWECAHEDYHFLFIMRYIDVMTVIGNIHDSPELLGLTKTGGFDK